MTWTRPRALRPGDLVGVCAPAGPVDAERLSIGRAQLEALGFRVRVPEGILEVRHFTAGSAERRRHELLELFHDEEVAGIVCARGGAGAAQLLGSIDGDALRTHTKVFVGYSDITFLHLFLNRLGMVTFHGPMVARELADGSYDRGSFLHALTGEGGPYISGPEDLEVLREGEGVGRLRGGCLSILAAAAGTAWALAPAEETVLFIEDVQEKPYRIHRMLLQLRQSGALSGVNGIVFGDMKGCAPSLDETYSLEDVVLDALEGLAIPVALGLSSGHTVGPLVTLPFGTPARIACRGGEARFEILESAVVA